MKEFGKRISNLARRTIPVLFLLFVIAAAAQAATVRGRLVRNGYGGVYGVGYVTVTLWNQSRGRSAPAVTGADGMYYFYNVPPDNYYLQVWLYPGKAPLTYVIRVNDPGTDVPPILLP
jgi:hypothetical protein